MVRKINCAACVCTFGSDENHMRLLFTCLSVPTWTESLSVDDRSIYVVTVSVVYSCAVSLSVGCSMFVVLVLVIVVFGCAELVGRC